MSDVINLGCEGFPEDEVKEGFYFRSDKDVESQYVVLYEKGNHSNAVVKVYEEMGNSTTSIENGTKCRVAPFMCEFVFKIDLRGKYFFPVFNNRMQMYYDDKKYYDGSSNTDIMGGIVDCFNFAIEIGLRESGIKPY